MASLSWIDRYRMVRLIVKRALATLQAGTHASIFKGAGLAFEEVRHYQPGDEVRTIDWNVTARMGQPFVKRFVEERELRILFLVDVSGSQQIGSGSHLKRDIAAEIVALLALAGLRHGDSLGLALFTDQIERYLAPARSLRHILRLIHLALYSEPEHQKTDLTKAFDFARKVMRRHAVVVVLSDFLDQDWQPALERLAHRHDVIAIRITDPLDVQMPRVGLVRLEDAETEQERLVDANDLTYSASIVKPRRGTYHWVEVGTDGMHLEHLLKALQSRPARRRAAR
jgi:uncharacterized protein (DUF58 family)